MSTTWLEKRRAEARAVYERTPLPTLREENWRYTSLRGIDFDAFRVPEDGAGAVLARPSILTGREVGGRLHQRGQTVVERRLERDVADQGVTFGSLEAIALERPDLVEPHLGRIVGTGD